LLGAQERHAPHKHFKPGQQSNNPTPDHPITTIQNIMNGLASYFSFISTKNMSLVGPLPLPSLGFHDRRRLLSLVTISLPLFFYFSCLFVQKSKATSSTSQPMNPFTVNPATQESNKNQALRFPARQSPQNGVGRGSGSKEEHDAR
jgi:hypothetical protein